MLVKKSDIGGEIISILTRGMYLDPKDALREYVQNGVDAQAKNIKISIRQDIIVVQDDGTGMDRDIMRKAIRVGISEKNPNKNVGFMGIGIYSSFHLCDTLDIYSKTKDGQPNLLHFNFKGMREKLSKEREIKHSSNLSEVETIALQDLLEEFIELTSLNEGEFPNIGTRVEITGIELSFFKTLSKFPEVANYLEQVVALPFNPNFSLGKEIQNYILTVCKDHKISFSLVNLDLQINDEQRTLYRPYNDSDFDPVALEPKFFVLKSDTDFFGVAWGCLNQSTKTIKNNSIRGFAIKKQGFTIGNRNDLIPYFGKQTYYNRYVGEVLVLHPQLLPNASRSEFEYSPLRTNFQVCLKNMAEEYNKEATAHQETFKAQEDLNNAINHLKEKKAQFEFYLGNSDELLTTLWETKAFAESLVRRNKSKYFKGDDVQKAETVIQQLEDFARSVREEININKSKRRRKKGKTELEVASDIEQIPDASTNISDDKYENLLQVFDSIGLEINKELRIFIDLIDDNYIRFASKDNIDYISRLSKLKNDFEELLEE